MKLLVQRAQGLSGIHEEEEKGKKGEEEKEEEKEGSMSGKEVYQGQVISISILTKNLYEKHLQTPTWIPRQYVPV